MANAECIDLLNKVRRKLEEFHLQLNIVRAGAAVAAQALKVQNAEQDADIACVLEYFVDVRLESQLKMTETLLYELDPNPSAEPPEHYTDGEQQAALQ